jgi:hypothetical protein
MAEQRGHEMNDWSHEDEIAMARRQCLEGEQLLARQQALLEKLVAQGHHGLVEIANQLTDILRESMELSRARLRGLEHRQG